MLKLVPCSQPRDVYPLTKFNSLFNSCFFDCYKIQIQTETRSLSLNHQIAQILGKRRTLETFWYTCTGLETKGHFHVYNSFPQSPAPFVASHEKKTPARNKVMIDFVRRECFVFITRSWWKFQLNDGDQLNFAQKISWALEILCPQNNTVLRGSKDSKELLGSLEDYWGKLKNFTRPMWTMDW